MAETIHVRGEGGAILTMDLPLPEGIAERSERDADDASEAPAAPVDRPAVNAPKAEWIAYVVKGGRLSAEDAANYTKADLIDMVS